MVHVTTTEIGKTIVKQLWRSSILVKLLAYSLQLHLKYLAANFFQDFRQIFENPFNKN